MAAPSQSRRPPRLSLLMLPDGDIEIWEGRRDCYGNFVPLVSKRVHKSFNPGETLKGNLAMMFEMMERMEADGD